MSAAAGSPQGGGSICRGGTQRRSSPGLLSVLASPGAPFQRSQHPHATSCRHFHLGPLQPQQLTPDFPLAHPVQSQPGLSAHMAPAHQHSGALHQSLTPLPTLPFQDVTGPSFLPQALHQQYLLQQQLLEAQHRRLVSHPRWVLPGGQWGWGGTKGSHYAAPKWVCARAAFAQLDERDLFRPWELS